jgi:hypothetical protein
VRRLITATGAGLAAAAMAILFCFSGVAHAQSGSGSGSGTDTGETTTTEVSAFSETTAATGTLAQTGADTWILVTGAGVAVAGSVGARRLLRSRATV